VKQRVPGKSRRFQVNYFNVAFRPDVSYGVGIESFRFRVRPIVSEMMVILSVYMRICPMLYKGGFLSTYTFSKNKGSEQRQFRFFLF